MKPSPVQLFKNYFQSSQQLLYFKDEQNRFTFFDNENVYVFIPSHLSNLHNHNLLPISYIQDYIVYKEKNNFNMESTISGKVSSSSIRR